MPHTEGAEGRRREASPHRGSETPIRGCPAPRPSCDTGTPASLRRPDLVSTSALRSSHLRHPRLDRPPAPASRPPFGIRYPPTAPSASAFQSSRLGVRIPTSFRHPRLDRCPPPPGPHRQSRQKPMPEAPGRSRRPEPPELPENGSIRVAKILPGLRRRNCRGRKRTGSSTPPEHWAAALPEHWAAALPERRAAVSPERWAAASSQRRELTSPRCRKPVLPKRWAAASPERQVPASPERRAPAPPGSENPHRPGTGNPCRQCHRRHPHRQHCQGTRKPPTPHGNTPSRRALIKFDEYFGNGFSQNFQYITETRKEQDKGSSRAPSSDRNSPFR